MKCSLRLIHLLMNGPIGSASFVEKANLILKFFSFFVRLNRYILLYIHVPYVYIFLSS